MGINIKNLTDSDKGRRVVYTDGCGDKEYGKISSHNDTFIHVLYDGKNNTQATSPKDLDFVEYPGFDVEDENEKINVVDEKGEFNWEGEFEEEFEEE